MVEDVDAQRDAADERRQEKRDQRRGDEGGNQMSGSAGPAARHERHAAGAPAVARRPGRPGTGNRAQISATSAASRPLRGRLVAALDRLDDQLGRCRASRPSPKPRVVAAGVPIRIPDEVFGGCWSNGIVFLLTVIPISSRSALRLLAGNAERHHVDEHEVVVGAAGDQPRALARPASRRARPRSRPCAAGRAGTRRRARAGTRPPCRR